MNNKLQQRYDRDICGEVIYTSYRRLILLLFEVKYLTDRGKGLYYPHKNSVTTWCGVQVFMVWIIRPVPLARLSYKIQFTAEPGRHGCWAFGREIWSVIEANNLVSSEAPPIFCVKLYFVAEPKGLRHIFPKFPGKFFFLWGKYSRPLGPAPVTPIYNFFLNSAVFVFCRF